MHVSLLDDYALVPVARMGSVRSEDKKAKHQNEYAADKDNSSERNGDGATELILIVHRLAPDGLPRPPRSGI